MTDHPSSTKLKVIPAQTTEFLSIKEAAERYAKAEITIRRFVRGVMKNEKGTERQGIQPLPADANKLKKAKKPFSYTISSELLQKHFGETSEPTSKKSSSGDALVNLLERTNTTLQTQLQVKDDQIKLLAQAIEELSQRQRETNILMKGMQEQFLLSSGQGTEKKKKHWWSR